MSTDPVLPLQVALVGAMKADPPIAGGRAYDAPPKSPTYPYVTLGEAQILPDRGTDYEGSDVSETLHVWSRAVGFPEAIGIAGAIRARLAGGLALPDGTRLVDLVFETTRFLRSPDGETSHAVLTFTARTEPA